MLVVAGEMQTLLVIAVGIRGFEAEPALQGLRYARRDNTDGDVPVTLALDATNGGERVVFATHVEGGAPLGRLANGPWTDALMVALLHSPRSPMRCVACRGVALRFVAFTVTVACCGRCDC